MKRFSLAILALVVATGAQAASEKVEMNLVTSQGLGSQLVASPLLKPIKVWSFHPI